MKKQKTKMKLTPEALRLLAVLSKELGIKKREVFELAIRYYDRTQKKPTYSD